MDKCKHCDTVIPDAAQFCSSCGREVDVQGDMPTEVRIENIFDEIDFNLSARLNHLLQGVVSQPDAGSSLSAGAADKTWLASEQGAPVLASDDTSNTPSLPFLHAVSVLPYPAVAARTLRSFKGRNRKHGALLFSSIVVVTAMLVALCIVLLFKEPLDAAGPELSIIGEAAPGHSIILHGSQFTPGNKLTIAVDNQPVLYTDPPNLGAMAYVQEAARSLGMSRGGVITTTVRGNGTFDATISVDARWQVGSRHTIWVYGQTGQLLRNLVFTVASGTATGLRQCAPEASIIKLNLGSAVAGQSQTLSAPFTLCSQGGGLVHWTSSWDAQQAPWLSLPRAGQITAPQSQRLLVSVSSSGLKE
ncbi:MAG TPA: zinc ribbon domain-containing protein, partial [Ktedonobacteraceae bacterium]